MEEQRKSDILQSLQMSTTDELRTMLSETERRFSELQSTLAEKWEEIHKIVSETQDKMNDIAEKNVAIKKELNKREGCHGS